MDRKVSVIIQARMGSERLHGKILKTILGKPMLWHIVDRVRQCELVDNIIVATTNCIEDNLVEEFCIAHGIMCFRGDELDVLDRYYQCAKTFGLKDIVRLTGDNALVDSEILAGGIRYYFASGNDYISYRKGLPLGLSVEIFGMKSLEKSWTEATDPECREHVTVYMYRNGNMFKWEKVKSRGVDRSNLRLTVDTEQDFELVTRIYKELYKEGSSFSIEQVYELIDKKPELLSINDGVLQKKIKYHVRSD